MFHIIIPTYNRSKTIRRAIDSILNQNYNNAYIYVIDDGSTDSTKKIIDTYYSHIDNLTYLYKQNGGVSSARNLGIRTVLKKAIEKDYILFLDSDDELSKDSLQYIEKILLSNKNISYFAFGVESNLGNKTFINTINNQELSYFDSLKEEKAFGEFFRVLKVEVFINNKSYIFPEPFNGGEDILWLSINKKYNLLVSNYIVRKYYLDNNGITRELLNKQKVINFLNITKTYLFLFGKDLKLFNKKKLGIMYLVYARMLALNGKRLRSVNYGFKGLVYSFDLLRFFLYIFSFLPYGMKLNNLILRIKK